MTLARFGLYFVPQPGRLFEVGSAITGYNVRTGQTVGPPGFVMPEWQIGSSEFGFHVTVTDAIYFDPADLDHLRRHTREVLSCFNPANRYMLEKQHVEFWGEDNQLAVLKLQPNREVQMLHDVGVASLHPLGAGSEYTDAYQRDPAGYFSASPFQINQTKHFYAPYIFDNFNPHFTLLNPYRGSPEEQRDIEARLVAEFEFVEELEIDSLALVVQGAGEAHFRIVEEFSLHGQ